jgi:hypothetical protein
LITGGYLLAGGEAGFLTIGAIFFGGGGCGFFSSFLGGAGFGLTFTGKI